MGREIPIPDLRAGFAYVMASLIASDTSIISGLPFLERGYENLLKKLEVLGADVSLIKAAKTEKILTAAEASLNMLEPVLR